MPRPIVCGGQKNKTEASNGLVAHVARDVLATLTGRSWDMTGFIKVLRRNTAQPLALNNSKWKSERQQGYVAGKVVGRAHEHMPGRLYEQ